MTPLHELLSRIRWDPAFGRGRFELGYRDRVERRIVRVALSAIRTDPAAPAVFQVTDEDGETHTIPFHRVKEVYRDGILVWQRDH